MFVFWRILVGILYISKKNCIFAWFNPNRSFRFGNELRSNDRLGFNEHFYKYHILEVLLKRNYVVAE